MKIFKHSKDNQVTELKFETFTFPGGEEHFRLQPTNTEQVARVHVAAQLINSQAVMQLCLATDALNRVFGRFVEYHLTIAYFPYARQDRVCVPGEALSASVMANIINNLNYDKVTIWDAHSDVSTALINNVTNVSQSSLLARSEELSAQIQNGLVTLVAPDAGAMKKTLSLAQYFESPNAPIFAEKIRDLKTGQILKTEVKGDIKDKALLIVDDICDGGRTFVELAKVLKTQGAANISLYVTHGIFSKGLEVFDGLIDHVYTTDSFQVSSNTQLRSNTVKLTIL